LTIASASGSYLTTASAQTLYQATGSYLTTASAQVLYQASGSYLTTASASSIYLRISSASGSYLTTASAQTLYQPTGSYLTTSTASSTYLTIASASGSYLTTASAGTIYAPLSAPSFTGKIISTGDISLNSRLYVGQDVSINGNLVVNGNLIAQTITNLKLINTTTSNYQLIVSEDISLNGRLYASGDVSLNSRLYVAQDVSMAGRLFVSGTGRSIINTDVSLNGNVTVTGNFYANYASSSIPPSAISGGVQTNGMDLSTNQTVAGQKTFTSLLIVNNDASLNGNVVVVGNLTAITQASSDNSTKAATTAYVKSQGYATAVNPSLTGVVGISGSVGINTVAPQFTLDIAGGSFGCGRYAQFGSNGTNYVTTGTNATNNVILSSAVTYSAASVSITSSVAQNIFMSAATPTLTLPTPSSAWSGAQLNIRKIGSAINTALTVAGSTYLIASGTSSTVVASISVPAATSGTVFICDGTNWYQFP
jgi:hypothetical protein